MKTLKNIIIATILLAAFGLAHAVNGFDLQNYYASHRNENKATFIKNFPYQTYLQQVQFTDFAALQSDRTFLWRTFGDGDEFLYYLGENFVKYYPIDLSRLTDTIAIGEAYIKSKPGIKNTANEMYQIIGYYLLGRVAQKIEQEIKRGKFDPETTANKQLIQRLEQNRVYVTIERGTIANLMYNIKQGKWDYVFNRAWLQSKEIGQKASSHYDDLLGDDFFNEYFKTGAPTQSSATSSALQISLYQRYYPLPGSGDSELTIYRLKTQSFPFADIGYAVWLRRPNIKATYFAYQNVSSKFRTWAQRNSKQVVLAMTGGFTNTLGQPEGLTVEGGNIVNAVLMPDRHGLIIVHDSGGISVVNLRSSTIKLPMSATEVLEIKNPLQSLIAYSQLLDWCKKYKATLFQTQLLAFSDQLMIDVGKAKSQLRERRILTLVRDKNTGELHHIVFDITASYNLAMITQDIFDLCVSRGKKIEAILNLDVGSYNILNVFDTRGNLLSCPQGPVSISNATNLIVYTK